MGFYCFYIAIPDDSELLKRAKRDKEFAEELSPGMFCGGGDFIVGGGGDIWLPRTQIHSEFLDAVKKINEAHPGINTRIYSLDKSYHRIAWLLSWQCREGIRGYEDLGSQAVFGASKLPRHMIGSQGHPTRYSASYKAMEIALWLDTIPIEEVRQMYEYMCEVKADHNWFRAEDAYEKFWLLLKEYFEGLKAFYNDLANHDEGTIVWID